MLKISTPLLAKQSRLEILKMIYNSQSAHIGSAFSCIDIICVIYNDILNISPKNIKFKKRDIFILSKGHACSALYAVLALKGFFPKNKLKTYGKDFSYLMSHASHHVPGVEFSSGSLGHGLPFGVGNALALKIKKINSRVYVLMSDGELNEGSNWEAIMFASHHKLNNLTFIIDNNNLQSLTTIKDTLNIYPLESKFRSFGLDYESVNGHDYRSLERVLKKQHPKKPRVIIAKTIKGKGIKKMENKVIWHYKPPSKTEFNDFLAELNNL